jgi:light-regulated signal transduction histidine kinase (bacteriophytochrome)
MPLNDFLSQGGLLVFAGALFCMAMIVFRHHSVKAMIISRLELLKNNEWMSVQNEIIEEKSLELQRSNNRLKEFAYIVSHDLKTPLRGIKNLAAWIREDYSGDLPAEGVSHLRLIEKQIGKMENLIKAVLDYSKSGNANAGIEWINLDDIINEVIEMVDVDNRTKFVINSQIPQIKGTRIVISQVLQNLMSNSIKHNDKAMKEVELEIKEQDEFILFSVTDNGPGINPSDQKRIFNLFQTLRADNNYECTGIGLPVSKKMVEESGGNMWLESMPGKGSIFYFSLPKSA